MRALALLLSVAHQNEVKIQSDVDSCVNAVVSRYSQYKKDEERKRLKQELEHKRLKLEQEQEKHKKELEERKRQQKEKASQQKELQCLKENGMSFILVLRTRM